MSDTSQHTQEIRERLDAATPGPWALSFVGSPRSSSTTGIYSNAFAMGSPESEVLRSVRAGSGNPIIRRPDADLIANAREDIAFLLEQVADLTARRDAYEAMRQRLAETLDAVRGLHQPFRIYDECGHEHLSEGEPGVVEAEGVGLTCADGFMYEICGHCCVGGGDGQSEECATEHDHGADRPICKTVAVLDGGAS